MEKLIKFSANDGRLFDSEIECLNYEKFLFDVQSTMDLLKKRPDNNKFSNGEGYIQQNKETIEAAMIKIVELSGLDKMREWNDFYKDPFNCRNGIIGRYISESCYPVLSMAWYRFQCMDFRFREWGQPYFASHINETKCFEIK